MLRAQGQKEGASVEAAAPSTGEVFESSPGWRGLVGKVGGARTVKAE